MKKKVLIVGLGRKKQHEESFASAFERSGFSCSVFAYDRFLGGSIGYLTERFLVGPVYRKINLELNRVVHSFQPNLIFLYRATLVSSDLIRKLKDEGFVFVSFNPDTFAGQNGAKKYWSEFKRYLKYCSINYVYRESDYNVVNELGSPNTKLLMSCYVKHLTSVEETDLLDFDVMPREVGFYGHCEGDDRLKMVENLIAHGHELSIFGVNWKKYLSESSIKKITNFGGSLEISDYVSAIRHTKVCLCFFSSWNNDFYTRRVFEIPMCGSVLACPRNPFTLKLFNEDEVLFFDNFPELNDKLSLVLKNKRVWKRYRERGRKRILTSGHEVFDRVQQIISDLEARL